MNNAQAAVVHGIAIGITLWMLDTIAISYTLIENNKYDAYNLSQWVHTVCKRLETS